MYQVDFFVGKSVVTKLALIAQTFNGPGVGCLRNTLGAVHTCWLSSLCTAGDLYVKTMRLGASSPAEIGFVQLVLG